jgi:hypothetical protein
MTALDAEAEFIGKHCMEHRGVSFYFLMTGGIVVQALLLAALLRLVHNLILYRAQVFSSLMCAGA